MVEVKIKEDGAAEIEVGSDIAGEVVEDLRHCIEDALEQKCLNLSLDMSNVQYVNSSGLSILIGAHTRAGNEGGHVAMKHVSQDLFDFFESVNLTSVFDMQCDEGEGLADS